MAHGRRSGTPRLWRHSQRPGYRETVRRFQFLRKHPDVTDASAPPKDGDHVVFVRALPGLEDAPAGRLVSASESAWPVIWTTLPAVPTDAGHRPSNAWESGGGGPWATDPERPIWQLEVTDRANEWSGHYILEGRILAVLPPTVRYGDLGEIWLPLYRQIRALEPADEERLAPRPAKEDHQQLHDLIRANEERYRDANGRLDRARVADSRCGPAGSEAWLVASRHFAGVKRQHDALIEAACDQAAALALRDTDPDLAERLGAPWRSLGPRPSADGFGSFQDAELERRAAVFALINAELAHPLLRSPLEEHPVGQAMAPIWPLWYSGPGGSIDGPSLTEQAPRGEPVPGSLHFRSTGECLTWDKHYSEPVEVLVEDAAEERSTWVDSWLTRYSLVRPDESILADPDRARRLLKDIAAVVSDARTGR
jgi:hypothetical protein